MSKYPGASNPDCLRELGVRVIFTLVCPVYCLLMVCLIYWICWGLMDRRSLWTVSPRDSVVVVVAWCINQGLGISIILQSLLICIMLYYFCTIRRWQDLVKCTEVERWWGICIRPKPIVISAQVKTWDFWLLSFICIERVMLSFLSRLYGVGRILWVHPMKHCSLDSATAANDMVSYSANPLHKPRSLHIVEGHLTIWNRKEQ